MHNAIQFIGTQRSGSNLLRLILNQHDLISAPHPPHLLKTFVPLLPHYEAMYGNPLPRLIEDMCLWVEYNPVPWTDVVLDREMIAQNATSIYDVFKQIYIQKANVDKARIWCCKSTFNVHYVDQLERKIRPFYIHLYRDGRDVAASFKKILVGQKHAYHLAKQWHQEQVIAMNFLKGIEPGRKIQISYESLLDRPAEVVGAICDKLKIDYDDKMLNYYTSEESQHTADSGKMWESVIKPIIKNNKEKFFGELTEEDIRIFEKVAGSTLRQLGYRLVYQDNDDFDLDIDRYNVLNAEMIAEGRKNSSDKELQKRARQERLLEGIKQKFEVEG